MNDDIWSRQFYKALEAVGKLTEVEKLRLADILIAVSDIKEKPSSTGSISRGCTARGLQINPPPEPPENKKVKW